MLTKGESLSYTSQGFVGYGLRVLTGRVSYMPVYWYSTQDRVLKVFDNC